jgi:hypothetical protein
MKFFSFVLALAMVLGSSLTTAQDSSLDSIIELVRSDLQTQKKALIEKVMVFNEKESSVFWPFYREYQLEMSKLGDKRIAILKDYAANYEKLDDKKADELVKQSIALQTQRLKVMENNYKKAAKLIGIKRAAQWLQVENQIMTLIDAKMVAETPLVK